MKRLITFAVLVGGCAALAPATASCNQGQAKTANDWINGFLNTAQYACTQTSSITDAPALAIACGIINVGDKVAPEVETFLETLILGRQAMLAKGMHFERAKWVKH